MPMISSLDALEADTNATSAPRAAVFQPKVKPRARKGGGGGGETKSVPAKPPPTTAPREKPAVAPVDPSSLAAAERFITETDSLSKDEERGIQDARPPVAVRSNFPVPSPATRGFSSDEDVGLAGRSSPERGGEVRLASEPSCSQDADKSDLPNSENPNSAPIPKPSTSGRADRKKQEVEKSRPPSKNAIDEEQGGTEQQAGVEEEEAGQQAEQAGEKEEGGEQQAVTEDDGGEQEPVANVEDEVEPVSEVPTGKRGRKRKFSHTTSQPRMNRPERNGVALKIDFSKTDLSNPSKLTMREIIRRAEAIERKKLKAEGNKKSAQNDGKQKQAALLEEPERDAVSMAPQVQVINGRIVINEQSLTVGAYATSRLNTEAYTRVEENAPRLNYNSYRDKAPTERWKTEDTDVFYLALKQFGTDFELIQNLFPGRTRRQVKAKFKKEERNNPRRLQEALAHRPKDQAHYTDMISRLKADELGPTADDPLENIVATFNPTV